MLTRRGFVLVSAASTARSLRAQPADLTSLTLERAAQLVRQKTVSPVDLTAACLKRIEKLNPKLNAFITVTSELAKADARTLESEARQGRLRGPLHGVPIALKDNVDTAGVRTTGASALFADRFPAEDAEVWRRLKAAGAILLGKLNLHEFAFGGTTVVSHFGPTRNPWHLDTSASGSSGGSGAAVAAEMCFGALGSDTGGSIRGPAAACGIVGLKPTYGRVSNRGVIPLGLSLDCVGPMCRTVADTALLFGVLAGFDAKDTTSADVPVNDYVAALRNQTSGLRIGIPRAIFFDKLDGDVSRAVDRAIEALRGLTASVRDVVLPSTADLAPIIGAEAYAWHARHIAQNASRYQAVTRKRLQSAANTTAAAYIQARQEVERVRREVRAVFSQVDLLVTPTAARPPYSIDESLRRDESDTLPPILNNTSPFNTYGLPAVSVPCGFTTAGLPIGLQIAGPPWGEGQVLALAHAYEQATEWHKKRPGL